MRLVEFVKELHFDKVGIAHFGPLCLNEESREFGKVTSTPKKQWQKFDTLGEFKKLLKLKSKKFVIETDVNAAAMAEFQMGILNFAPIFLPPPLPPTFLPLPSYPLCVIDLNGLLNKVIIR